MNKKDIKNIKSMQAAADEWERILGVEVTGQQMAECIECLMNIKLEDEDFRVQYLESEIRKNLII